MTIGFLLVVLGCVVGPGSAQSAVTRSEAPPITVTIPGEASEDLTVHVVIRAGSAWDPPGREGLAAMAARAILEADTATHTAAALHEALGALAAAPTQVSVDRELVRFTTQVPADHAAAWVPLFAEQLTQSRPSQALVEALRATWPAPTLPSGDARALGALDLWLHQGHPYGHLPEGRSAGLATLTATDVTRFYTDRYLRAAVTVGVRGDPAIARALSEALGGLPAAITDPPTPKPRPPATQSRVLLVNDAALAVPRVVIGQPIDLRVTDPRLAALLPALRALELRLDCADGAPLLRADRVQPHVELALGERGLDAIGTALGALDALVRDGLDADTLAAALASLDRSLAHARRAPLALLDAAAVARALGGPDPFQAPVPTLEQVNEALHAALQPNRWRVVVVTADPARDATALEESPTRYVSPDNEPVYADVLTITTEELTR